MGDLTRFCFVNPECPDHGKRGHGNLTVPARYGPHKPPRPPLRHVQGPVLRAQGHAARAAGVDALLTDHPLDARPARGRR